MVTTQAGHGGPRTGRVTHLWYEVRLILVLGWLGYRALFNWIKPSVYVPVVLVLPLSQVAFFAIVGPAYGTESAQFYLVGNALQITAMAAVHGTTMTVANERFFGTLQMVLLVPRNRIVVLFSRSLPLIVNGVALSACGLVTGWMLFDLRWSGVGWSGLAAAVVVSAVSCTALGMAVGALGLLVRDVFVGSNLVYFALMALSGASVPLTSLPPALRYAGLSLPLTRGIEAARLAAAGESLSSAVVTHLIGEASVGVCWFLVAIMLLFVVERAARASGSLDYM